MSKTIEYLKWYSECVDRYKKEINKISKLNKNNLEGGVENTEFRTVLTEQVHKIKHSLETNKKFITGVLLRYKEHSYKKMIEKIETEFYFLKLKLNREMNVLGVCGGFQCNLMRLYDLSVFFRY